jgi:hypothetical protein
MTIKAARDQHPDAWRPFTKPPRGTRDPELNLDARAQAFLDRIAPLSADLAAQGHTSRSGAQETPPYLPGRGPQTQSQALSDYR